MICHANMSDLPTEERSALTPTARVTRWLQAFDAALTDGELDAVLALFMTAGDDCYWRDIVAFTWNISTQEGTTAIRAMLRERLVDVAPSRWAVEGEATEGLDAAGLPLVEALVTFETRVGRGRGHIRLRPSTAGDLGSSSGSNDRAWTVLTTLVELKVRQSTFISLRDLAGPTLYILLLEPPVPARNGYWQHARGNLSLSLIFSPSSPRHILGG